MTDIHLLPDEKNLPQSETPKVVVPTAGVASPSISTSPVVASTMRSSDIPRGWTQFAVNLIPSELSIEEHERIHRRLALGIVIGCVGFILAGAYAGITWWQVRSSYAAIDQLWQEVDATQESLDSQRRQIQDLVVMNHQLGALEKMLHRHVYWTNFFDLLERATIAEVTYKNFSMTGTEKVVLSAIGTDYTSVARQLLAFRSQPSVVTAETTGAAAEIGASGEYLETTFTITLTLKPDLFITPPSVADSTTL